MQSSNQESLILKWGIRSRNCNYFNKTTNCSETSQWECTNIFSSQALKLSSHIKTLLIIITVTLGGQHFHPCLHQLGVGTVNAARRVHVNLSCLTVHLSPAAVTWPQTGCVTLVTVERDRQASLSLWSLRTGVNLTTSQSPYGQGGAPEPALCIQTFITTCFLYYI